MPEKFVTGLYGAIGGMFIAVASALGFKSSIGNKVSKDAFAEYKQAQRDDHRRIENTLNKIIEKVDIIHKDMPKRNGDTSG